MPHLSSLVLWAFSGFVQCQVAAGEQKVGGERVWVIIAPFPYSLANMGPWGIRI